VREERLEVAGVPARLYDPGAGQGLLLFGHGGGHSKDSERFMTLARRYAGRTGLAVVCIDAVDHGNRAGPAAGPGIPPGWHSGALPRMVSDWQKAADALGDLGPAVAYVGFSMGMIFGAPTVAAMPSIAVAVFVAGGIPAGGWIDDPGLSGLVLKAASGLGGRQVLMLNATGDELFPAQGAHEFFDAIPGLTKRLVFRPGGHDDWPSDAIDESISHINAHVLYPPSR
jgi:pimeloyl-ACP methyl ester carboxylesterase